MPPIRLSSLCFIVLFAVACTGTRTGDQDPTPVPVLIGSLDGPSDQFRLNAAAVAGEILTVEVSYGGGCRNHKFTLRAATTFRQSSAVQLEMTLTHDANDDPCEAWLTKQLRLDLHPIRERYQAQFDQESGTVFLLLAGHPGQLVYRW